MKNIISFSSTPLWIIPIISFLFFIIGLYIGVDSLFVKLQGNELPGYTTIVIFLLLIESSILFCLSVMSTYLALIYNEIKRRPRYIIEKKLT